MYQRGNLLVTPITEFVGWTVLNGLQSVSGFIPAVPPPGIALPQFHGAATAGGDTIVNVKLGVRTYLGRRHSFYTGWGHSLTGDHWYKNDYRVEYRFTF